MKESPHLPINVLHIIARMNVGGPAVEIAELMRGLDPGVVSQRLVTGHCADGEADFLDTQSPDVAATRIDGLGRTIRPTDDALALGRLVGMIRASRPDIVHTHTAKAGVLGRVAALAAGTGARIVHTHHGHLLHGYFGPAKTRSVATVEQGLARVTDTMITVGARVRDDLLAAGIGRPEQYTVIRSGVRLGALPDRAVARRDLGIPDGPLVISMIGRVTRIKRPDRFADVVRIIRDWGLDVHVVVAGGGDEMPGLAARIAREDLPVTLVGWRSDLERILAATDVVVLTSDNEGTPLSLVQAGLAGVPAVATRVGSVPEVVEDGVSGVLCSPSAPAVAESLARVLRDPGLRSRLGAGARAKANRDFGMEPFLTGHIDVYTSAVERMLWREGRR
jgi:glycosyltransferase involved in cell wall biosynthesis